MEDPEEEGHEVESKDDPGCVEALCRTARWG